MNFPFHVLIAKHRRVFVLIVRRFHPISCSIFFFLSTPSIEPWPKPTPSPRTENVSRRLRRVGFASRDSHRLVTRTYTRTFVVVCAHGSKELVSRDDWTIRHWRNKPEADLWGGENRRVLIIEETNPFVLAKGQQNSAVRCEIWPARTKSIASTLALVYVSLQVVVRRGNMMACEENSSRWNRALYIDRDNLSFVALLSVHLCRV